MKLNFMMEAAGLILAIFLCIITCAKYHIIDLKDRLFVKMCRYMAVITSLNMISYIIIRNNIFVFKNIAQVGLYVSFWSLVLILYYVNLYINESLSRKNTIAIKTYLLYGFPVFINLVLLLSNIWTNSVFEMIKTENTLKIIFNKAYIVPYLICFILLLIQICILVSKRFEIYEKKQQIFFVLPFLFVLIYYLQYRFKSVATFGFGISIILLTLYLYSYNYNEKLDRLTRLPNMHSFLKMIEFRAGNSKKMTVVLISLNDFKYINQQYGYENGDSFIKEISKYLSGIVGKGNVARIGGDQFGVILDEIEDEKISAWTSKVLERFEQIWSVDKIEQKLSVSIITVKSPQYASDSEDIMQILSYMQQNLKQYRLNQCIHFDDVYLEKFNRRNQIISILKDIMTNKNMFVMYQPIYDANKNAYTRGEALFRLKDEKLGEIPPREFFPIAEEYGYVIEIGYVLIDKVCEYISGLKKEKKETPIISVNFSRQQLMAENVGEKIQSILSKYKLTPDCIAIEVPEEAFAIRFEHVKNRIEKLHEMGYHFYLDGFGAGFLNLTNLMELPFDLIKFNKNMIRETEENETTYLLISAMAAVFEESGTTILADGIESDHAKEVFDLLFMDYMQGYYFSAPVAEQQATELFMKRDIFEKNEVVSNEVNSIMDQVNSILEGTEDELTNDDFKDFDMSEEDMNRILDSLKE